jgi:hypothetical protein
MYAEHTEWDAIQTGKIVHLPLANPRKHRCANPSFCAYIVQLPSCWSECTTKHQYVSY